MAEICPRYLDANVTTIVPATDETGRRVIILADDTSEVRLVGGNARKLQRLALAFQAAIEGDVPHA